MDIGLSNTLRCSLGDQVFSGVIRYIVKQGFTFSFFYIFLRFSFILILILVLVSFQQKIKRPRLSLDYTFV